jgi:hypothetical protein
VSLQGLTGTAMRAATECLLDQFAAVIFHAVRAAVAHEGRAAAVGTLPVIAIGVGGKELVEQPQIGGTAFAIARDQRVGIGERDARQHLRRRGIADRQVVLHALHPGKQRTVARGDPAYA